METLCDPLKIEPGCIIMHFIHGGRGKVSWVIVALHMLVGGDDFLDVFACFVTSADVEDVDAPFI